jgi:hypothetical protein
MTRCQGGCRQEDYDVSLDKSARIFDSFFIIRIERVEDDPAGSDAE